MYVERYPRGEERISAAVHVFGVLLSIVGLVLLIIQANSVGRVGSLPAVIIYGASLMLLFSFSSVHHAAILPRIKHIFLVLDHCGIYLLIAGTYTPFCLLMPVGQRWTLLALIWGLALAGIGDMEQWYSLLPPPVYQRLKERVGWLSQGVPLHAIQIVRYLQNEESLAKDGDGRDRPDRERHVG